VTVIFTSSCDSLADWTSTSFASIVAGGHTGNGLSISGTGSALYSIPAAKQGSRLNVSFWWKTSGIGVAHDICSWRQGAVNNMKVASTTTGAMQLLGPSSGLLGASAAGLVVANTWYFIEVVNVRIADAPNGSATLKVNGTPVVTATGVDNLTGTGASPIIDTWGLTTTGSGQTQQFDDITLDMQDLGVTVKVWNGSAFVSAPVKVWNGSTFVDPVAVKTWNGSAFV
jgi:hypothetical protein